MDILFRIERVGMILTNLYRSFKYRSVEAIAKDAWSRMDDADKEDIRNLHNKQDMIKYHHFAGRWIRNFYGLWNPKNRLTRKYFIDGDKFVRNGINYHPDHPDAVSQRVLDKIWEIATAK